MTNQVKVLQEYPNSSYTLIERSANYQRYVVCYKFDKKSQTWAQGYYFELLENARNFATTREIEKLEENLKDYIHSWIDSIAEYVLDGNTL